MTTKKTFAFTALMATIFMLAISGTTQQVNAQIINSELHEEGESLLVILAEDGSPSLTAQEFSDIKDGEVAALNLFYSGPEQQARFDQAITFALILFSSLAVQIGTGGTPGTDIFTVTDDTTLTALTDAILGKQKPTGFTCITCVIELADQIAFDAGKDVSVLDIATDGVPETVDTEAEAKTARDLAVGDVACINTDTNFPNCGNLDGINGLGIGLDSDAKTFLLSLAFPEPAVDGLSSTKGFVVSAASAAQFEAAFTSKLFVEVECPPGTFGTPPNCLPPVVGGESFAIDNTALLIAGMSANMSLIAPIVLGIAGVSAYIIRSRMNKE